MIRVRRDKGGVCGAQANDNADPPTPFEKNKAWRKAYMRQYMRDWRKRVKALKKGAT